MCGIAGYFGSGDLQILKKMSDAISYRGPDDEGFYVEKNIGLTHRRLSIIDLSPGGHQPMPNEDGNIQIIFNGEIYNFEDLKKELSKKHVFRGHSDTEVIVHLFQEIGPSAFSKLEGMFAIALYDKKEGKLFLVRDRMGKKPLYYGIFNNTLLFGSEPKALIAHPAFVKEIDMLSLNKYFQYEYVPTPHTMFKGMFKLEPGHYAAYDGTSISKTKFWDVPVVSKKENISLENALARLDSLLYTAVKKRLMSDVPLGIFLSGGIDSSTVAYYAQKIATEFNTKSVKTFSIGFSEDSFDESKYAKKISEHLNTNHHEQILSANDSLKLIPIIADFLDEPIADASIIPTFLLSRFTRESVTVSLGGDGGDELLSGYDTFIAHKLCSLYEKIPFILRKNIIEKMLLLMPSSFKNMSFDFKAKKFINGFYGNKKYRNQRWLGAFTDVDRKKLFNATVTKEIAGVNVFEDVDRYIENMGRDISYDDQIMYEYLRTYMMDDILVKVDRASMYNSLEVRSPFLDTGVVEFLVSLPKKFKLRGLTTKYLLKRLMEDKLPRDIVYRKKKGFGIPLAKWLREELRPLVLELLSKDKLQKQGLFNPEYVHVLIEEHFSQKADNRKQIWTLLVFQMWYDRWYL